MKFSIRKLAKEGMARELVETIEKLAQKDEKDLPENYERPLKEIKLEKANNESVGWYHFCKLLEHSAKQLLP